MSRLPADKSRRPRRPLPRGLLAVAVGAAVIMLLAAVGVPLSFASRPSFFGGYERLERSYTTLQSSAHKGLACDACHADSRGPLLYEAALVGDFYRGLFGDPAEPAFVQLHKPTNAACLECHRYDWSMEAAKTMKLPHPAHLRVAGETRECVTCHKWTAHEEAYMAKHKAMPFSTVCASFPCHVGTKPAGECGTCHHVLQQSGVQWRLAHSKTVRAAGPNGCLESCHDAGQCRLCHTTGKRPAFSSNAATAGVSAVERQHVKPDWIARHGTIALADPKKCDICHVSTGECDDCHARRPAFHGPKSTWLAKHKDLSKGTQERRCLTCHEKPWCEECHKQFKEMR